MKGLQMSRAEAEAHQRKHGFFVEGIKHVNGVLAPSGIQLPWKAEPMNKTEREYSLILEAMKRRGEIIRWDFQGITLRWQLPENSLKGTRRLTYTPDFVVFKSQNEAHEALGYQAQWAITMIEVKGAHIWDDATVKFSAARTHWSQFAFEMHQKKGGQWKRLL